MPNLTIFGLYYIKGWSAIILSKYVIELKAQVWVGFVGTFCNNLCSIRFLQGIAAYSTVQSIQGLFLCVPLPQATLQCKTLLDQVNALFGQRENLFGDFFFFLSFLCLCVLLFFRFSFK
jgi:hypothetical protein